MAENLLSSAASAVTGELTRVLFTGLIRKLDRRAAIADMKVRRLDMLLIKINSAVEASEKHDIKNASLVKWRDRLKEAAAEGGEVLASFRQREVDAAAQATGDGDDGAQQQQQHHHQEDPSTSSFSSTAAATAIVGTNNNAPSGMPPAQGIFSATKTLLFSGEEGKEDMKRLNNAVERLEDLSRDISIFIKLLKLEILAPAPAPAPAPGPALTWTENGRILKKSRSPSVSRSNSGDPPAPELTRTQNACVARSNSGETPSSSITFISSRMPEGEEVLRTSPHLHRSTIFGHLGRLEEAFATICRIVELADGRDLSGYEWLAYWASILREAKWQGRAVLDGRAGVDKLPGRCDDQEVFDLFRFVSNMESLAREADSFSELACLCPTAVVLAS